MVIKLQGRTVAEFPLTAGVGRRRAGTGAGGDRLIAVLKECSIEVERAGDDDALHLGDP